MTASRPSRSLKVTDFSIDQKPACDFPLANDTNLILSRTISELSRRILIKLSLLTLGACFNSLVLTLDLATKLETPHYCVYRYIEPFRRKSPVWQTDRRTELLYYQRACDDAHWNDLQNVYLLCRNNIVILHVWFCYLELSLRKNAKGT